MGGNNGFQFFCTFAHCVAEEEHHMPCLAGRDYARFAEFRGGSEKALRRLPGSAAELCLRLLFNGSLVAACLTIKRVTSLQRPRFLFVT